MYNSDGLLEWVNQISNSHGSDISTDVNSNVVVTGFFVEDAKFNETTTLTSYGFRDAFIAQYNSSGELLWANKIGGEFTDQGFGISTDVTGNIFVSGSFNTTAIFDATNTLTTSGVDNGYIAKYNPSGNLEWSNKIGSTNYSFGYDCVTSQNNNIIVVGSFQGLANFDASTEMVSNGGGQDGFLAKYSGGDGSLVITSIDESGNNLPMDFSLNQNYPNPFNPTTTISYTIPKVETLHVMSVNLAIYDVLGNELTTLVNEEQGSGTYKVQFDASNLSSGVYYYQLKSGNFVEIKKMLLMK